MLNPKCDSEDRRKWTSALETWAKLEICPLEDPDHRLPAPTSTSSAAREISNHQEHDLDENLAKRPAILGPDPAQLASEAARRHCTRSSSKRYRRPRTIFHKALDALMMDWTDPSLAAILTTYEHDILWQEHIPTACARIDALKTHGYDAEALKLAVAIARTMKHNQAVAHQHWIENKTNYTRLDCTASGVARKPGFASWDGWIGHALNPIGCLFNTLAEPCILPEDKSRLSHHLDLASLDSSAEQQPQQQPPISSTLKYKHVPVSSTLTDSYLSLAVEAALIALAQQRIMPPGLYAQEKSVKQEERLVSKLQELDFDSTLMGILVKQVCMQLESGPTSGLGHGIHPESIPMQTYAKYLFHVLLPYDFELAFKVGLTAVRLPVLEELEAEQLPQVAGVPALAAAVAQHDRDPGDLGRGQNFVMSRIATRWLTLGHIESQQSALASRMLSAAKGITTVFFRAFYSLTEFFL